MLSLLSIVLLSSNIYLSAMSDLNSANEIIERSTHNSTGLLDSYYKEFKTAAIHFAYCTCGSEHLSQDDLLNSYYSKYLK